MVILAQDHYFTKNPKSGQQPFSFQVEVCGQNLNFWTDAGVFSKRKLDRGSRLLLESIQLEGAKKILDLGCGYGPIGITIARLLPEAEVFMSDLNRRAVELAQRNAKENHTPNVQLRWGDGFQPFAGEKFDLIVTNPPIRAGKALIYSLFADARGHLEAEGSLVVVMRTQQGAKSAQRKLQELYPRVCELNKGGGFRVYQARLG